MVQRKFNAALLIFALLFISFLIPSEQGYAYSEGPPYQSQPQLVYNPTDHSFLQVYYETELLVGQKLTVDGEPSGERSIYSDSIDPELWGQFDIAYDPSSQQFLLVWTTESDLVGAWLDVNGALIQGSEFTVVSNGDRAYYGPRIAYDSNAHQFAVLFNYDVGEVDFDYRAGLALVDPVTQSVANVQESMLGEYDFSSYDIIYDESVQRYLIVWTDLNDKRVYGMYVQWMINEYEDLDLVTEANHRVLAENAGYHIQAVYNPKLAQIAITTDYFDTQSFATGISVTSVTYEQTSASLLVPIPQSFAPDIIDFDIVYIDQGNQYAVVWQERTEGYQSLLAGVLLAEFNLVVEKEYDMLAKSSTYAMMPSLTAVPASDKVMLSFTSGEVANERIVTIPFGVVYEGLPQLLLPKLSYDLEHQQFLLLSSHVHAMDAEESNMQFSLNVRSISAQGQFENTIKLGTFDFYGILHYDLAYGGDQQHFAVWVDFVTEGGVEPGDVVYPVLYGRMLASDGTPSSDTFVIAENAISPVVKYDPGSGHYLVAYMLFDPASDEQPALHAVAVNKEGMVSDSVVVADIDINDEAVYIQIIYSNEFLNLAYDQSRQLFELVWPEVVNEDGLPVNSRLAGQTLKINPAVDQATIDLVGEQHLFQSENHSNLYLYKTVYDPYSRMIHVAWNNDSGVITGLPVTLTSNGPVFHEPYFVDAGNWNFELVYDAVRKQVLVAWLEQDELLMDRVNVVMEPVGSVYPSEWERMISLVAEGLSLDQAQFDISAVSTPSGPALFYYISTDLEAPTIQYGLTMADYSSSTHYKLKAMDGNLENPILITDIIRYIEQEQVTDAGTVKSLLSYIEAVYPVAFSLK